MNRQNTRQNCSEAPAFVTTRYATLARKSRDLQVMGARERGREKEKERFWEIARCASPPFSRNCGVAVGALGASFLPEMLRERLNELRYGAVVCSEGHGHNNETHREWSVWESHCSFTTTARRKMRPMSGKCDILAALGIPLISSLHATKSPPPRSRT